MKKTSMSVCLLPVQTEVAVMTLPTSFSVPVHQATQVSPAENIMMILKLVLCMSTYIVSRQSDVTKLAQRCVPMGIFQKNNQIIF